MDRHEWGTMSERQRVATGTIWEEQVGFSRAVRAGNLVFVSGTTATDEQGEIVGRDDPEAQTRYIIEKIGRALAAVGASLEDVVRTRIYLERADDWEAVGRAHAHYFTLLDHTQELDLERQRQIPDLIEK